MFPWKWKTQFLQTWRNFFTRSSKELCEFIIFFNENFFLKCSSGNVESDFDNIAENFLPNVENVSELTFFFQTERFVLKRSYGIKECKIAEPVEKFFPEARRKTMNLQFFSNNCVLHKRSFENIEWVLTILPKNLHPKTKKFMVL